MPPSPTVCGHLQASDEQFSLVSCCSLSEYHESDDKIKQVLNIYTAEESNEVRELIFIV